MIERNDPERNRQIAEEAAIREVMDKYGVSYEAATTKLYEIREAAKQYNTEDKEQE